ncbi:MAG: universal stress protein [Candidatus Neomarinimicrobiota bacterium]
MQSDRLISKILLFTDGSEGSIYAAKYGIVLAKNTGAELKAIYVVNIDLLKQLERARIFVKVEELDYERDLEEDGRNYLRHITELAAHKGLRIETELLKGTVHKIAIQKVEEWDADLLIMGELEPILSRSDTFHDETELIFRKARCSVLVIKDSERIDKIYETLP